MRLEESGSHLVKPSRPHVGAVAGDQPEVKGQGGFGFLPSLTCPLALLRICGVLLGSLIDAWALKKNSSHLKC